MSKNIGIWIDRKHAFVVDIGDGRGHLSRFHAGVDETFPPTEESRAEHHYTRNDFVSEKTLERKSTMERVDMYEQVMKSIGSVDAVWILGPGEVTTSDKMTEPQLIAKVLKHFAEPVENRS